MRKGKKIIIGMWLEKLFGWPKQTTYLEPLRNLQRNNKGLVGENTSKDTKQHKCRIFHLFVIQYEDKTNTREKGYHYMYFLKIIVELQEKV